MIPANYAIRQVLPSDFEQIIRLCRLVYPTEQPYTLEELSDHVRVFPQGQFAAVETGAGVLAGVHFTLRLHMRAFHLNDSWDVFTDGGTFLDHDPTGPTLYGADIMVSPAHQHHGLARALTESARRLVVQDRLWRMVGASRLPGFHKVSATTSIGQYVSDVIAGKLFDPVLSIHIKDGWSPVRPIHGYLQHDPESAGWAEIIQWVNPDHPPPPGAALGDSRLD
ncbi:MAG: GNAT family N-acetyltransferase [Phycisphaerales bacterium]